MEKYKACMVLSGAGDALGYRNQKWEYCTSGPQIHRELAELGGVMGINVQLPDWPVSDDTVMHLATAEGLTGGLNSRDQVFLEVARQYKECMKDMDGRKPGPTSIKGCEQLNPSRVDGFRIPFNPTGTGCGAAMRAMAIGLRFPRVEDEHELLAYSIECGRMTHHHPTGYLGCLVAALFTAYAIREEPVECWDRDMLDILPKAWSYVESVGEAVPENREAWTFFRDNWTWYRETREKLGGTVAPRTPDGDGIEQRDEIYKSFSLDGWAGRSGHDAPMIAYDALLASGKDWPQLCSRSMFHAGDSDSTGVIAAAWYGALYGFDGVPECNYMQIEYRQRLEDQAEKLYRLAGKMK